MLEWRIQNVLGKGIGFGSVDHEVRTIKNFLKELQIWEPMVFDVGANIGQFGLELFSQIPGCRVHSFEPGEESFRQLAVFSESNPAWNIHKFGFGDTTSVMSLYSEVAGSASSSLIARDTFSKDGRPQNRQDVYIRTLDDFIENDLKVIPDVVKFDVEGFEYACLQGTIKYIKDIKLIQFEFGQINIETRIFFRDFWIYFQQHGFDLYRVTSKSPIRIREYNETLETFLVTNYIALNNRFS
jgi:FkbM family methyltransferase